MTSQGLHTYHNPPLMYTPQARVYTHCCVMPPQEELKRAWRHQQYEGACLHMFLGQSHLSLVGLQTKTSAWSSVVSFS